MSASHSGPSGVDPDSVSFAYDEFAYFDENRSELGLAAGGDPPAVARIEHRLADGHVLRALRWGTGISELVVLHGGAQNAHTWDSVLLAMGAPPALAVDLPGHGHSDHRGDGRYDPRTSAAAVAEMLDAEVPDGAVVIGMSLGGLVATALAAARPDLVRRLVTVDVTPGVDRDKAADVVAFIAGPQSFPSFGEIFARTVEFNPTRSASSLRRGILHNAHRRSDGSWEWNYDRRQLAGVELAAMGSLWDDVSATTAPMLLVRGGASPVVDDADVAEVLRRRPDARVVMVDGAGHSVQGDRPLTLAAILSEELAAAFPQHRSVGGM